MSPGFFFQVHNRLSNRQSTKRSSQVICLAVCLLVLLLLAGCKFDLQPVENPSTQTATPPTSISSSDTPEPGVSESATVTLQQPLDIPIPEPGSSLSIETASGPTVTPWPNNTPTAGPSPTPSRTPTRTRVPTRTRAPTNTPTITYTPTTTFTPTPQAPDQLLLRPGLLSKVISPIQMEMYAISGEDGLVTVELIGEDGRLISRQVLNFNRGGRYVYAVPTIPFEIPAISEMARLQVRSQDLFGRSVAISSVDLILLSVGRSEINPPAITQEPYLIRFPRPRAVVSGGLLVVDGLARPVNDSILILELTTETGRVISTKTFSVDPPSGQLSHTPFHLEIPYKVDSTTNVRLSIRQEGSRIPGTVALNSILISLEP